MSTLDVVAYAGAEFPGSPKPANFLDIGGGASAEIMANGLEIIISDDQVKSVFVNVFGGITACDAVANGIVQAFELLGQPRRASGRPAGRTAGRQQRGTGSADPCRRGPAEAGAGRNHGRCGAGCRAGGELRGGSMAIFLNSDSKVIVQGMTGSEGRKHTQRMLSSGTDVVGGVTPGKGGQVVEFERAGVPVFDSVGEAMAATGANVTVIFVPAEVHLVRGRRGDRREHPARGGDHRRCAGQGHRRVLRTVRRDSSTRLVGPNCPGLISPGQSNAGIIPADITRPGASDWCPSRAR